MARAVTRNIHSTTDQELVALMGKILSPDGPTLTQPLSRQERWVLAHDTRHSMGTGVAGTGVRFLGSVRYGT